MRAQSWLFWGFCRVECEPVNERALCLSLCISNKRKQNYCFGREKEKARVTDQELSGSGQTSSHCGYRSRSQAGSQAWLGAGQHRVLTVCQLPSRASVHQPGDTQATFTVRRRQHLSRPGCCQIPGPTGCLTDSPRLGCEVPCHYNDARQH